MDPRSQALQSHQTLARLSYFALSILPDCIRPSPLPFFCEAYSVPVGMVDIEGSGVEEEGRLNCMAVEENQQNMGSVGSRKSVEVVAAEY